MWSGMNPTRYTASGGRIPAIWLCGPLKPWTDKFKEEKSWFNTVQKTTNDEILKEEKMTAETHIKRAVSRLPDHYKWTLHNLIAHPVSEVIYLLGFQNLSNRLHDATIPDHTPGSGRG